MIILTGKEWSEMIENRFKKFTVRLSEEEFIQLSILQERYDIKNRSDLIRQVLNVFDRMITPCGRALLQSNRRTFYFKVEEDD